MSESQLHHSTCPHDCPSTCALEVEVRPDQSIGRVMGAKGHPYTDGVICAKVANYRQRIHHPERLLNPLKRVGEKGIGATAFKEITWDEALDLVAESFLKIAQRHGHEAIWPYNYAGTMGLLQRDVIRCLTHSMGYSRQLNTVCSMVSNTGWTAGMGIIRGVDGREIRDTELLVVWGGNPVNTQVNVMHHYAYAKRKHGAKLLVIDPYQTDTARKADLHIKLRPGTDGAFACSIMRLLFKLGYADMDYLQQYSDIDDGLIPHLEQFTPESVSAICGIPTSNIHDFAKLYGGCKKSFLSLGYGFTRSQNGAVNMHAATCLPVITGAWQYKGGGALYSNSSLSDLDSSIITGLDCYKPVSRTLDMSRIGNILTGERKDLGDGPAVHALLIQSTNPVDIAPNSCLVEKGFARSDLFTCVHEHFMTSTAAMADIVLPATMFLEHEDLYKAGAHTFVQYAGKVIEPPPQCRSNHQLIAALGKRLGASHANFALDSTSILEQTLNLSGLPNLAYFKKHHWYDAKHDFDQMHFLDGFGHSDKRFHFRPDWQKFSSVSIDMPEYPDHLENYEKTDPHHPYRLVTAPARWFLNSSFTEIDNSRSRQKQPRLHIHPEDCRELKLEDGDYATVGNQRGQVDITVFSFEGVEPGVVIAESVWPKRYFRNGIGINALTSSKPVPPAGGAAFHDSAVWIRKADEKHTSH